MLRAQTNAGCGTVKDTEFRKVVLVDTGISDPMELSVAADGRVFFIERRTGKLKVYKPDLNRTVLAAQFNVTSNGNDGVADLEDGMMGLALAPGFPGNPWIYLYYSPRESKDANVLARFNVAGDKVDMNSEKRLLTVAIQRESCCHSSGSLAFGPEGNLYLSVGDNTNPWASLGFNPIDQRPGKGPFDAQKSSSNTNDLRGKILRIHPEPDGTYSIPAGNLFPPGLAKTRPEIFTMGNRNPFRIAVDRKTGWLYWGEVGPDAGSPSDNHGPAGFDEFNLAKTAGNYGWPYFVADNKAYRAFDFASNQSGTYYSASAPANASPNNTGLATLPAARSALLWYGHGDPSVLPGFTMEGNATAMGGPIYHYDSSNASKRKLPPQFDNHWFVYDWTHDWIKAVKLDAGGLPVEAKPFAAGMSIPHPVEMELGPDGALYLLEFGTGWFSSTQATKLVRIEYTGTCLPTGIAAPPRRSFTRTARALDVHDIKGRFLFTSPSRSP